MSGRFLPQGEGWYVAKHPDRDALEVVWVGINGTVFRAASNDAWRQMEFIFHYQLDLTTGVRKQD